MAPRIKFEPFDHIEDWHEALVDAKSAIYGRAMIRLSDVRYVIAYVVVDKPTQGGVTIGEDAYWRPCWIVDVVPIASGFTLNPIKLAGCLDWDTEECVWINMCLFDSNRCLRVASATGPYGVNICYRPEGPIKEEQLRVYHRLWEARLAIVKEQMEGMSIDEGFSRATQSSIKTDQLAINPVYDLGDDDYKLPPPRGPSVCPLAETFGDGDVRGEAITAELIQGWWYSRAWHVVDDQWRYEMETEVINVLRVPWVHTALFLHSLGSKSYRAPSIGLCLSLLNKPETSTVEYRRTKIDQLLVISKQTRRLTNDDLECLGIDQDEGDVERDGGNEITQAKAEEAEEEEQQQGESLGIDQDEGNMERDGGNEITQVKAEEGEEEEHQQGEVKVEDVGEEQRPSERSRTSRGR